MTPIILVFVTLFGIISCAYDERHITAFDETTFKTGLSKDFVKNKPKMTCCHEYENETDIHKCLETFLTQLDNTKVGKSYTDLEMAFDGVDEYFESACKSMQQVYSKNPTLEAEMYGFLYATSFGILDTFLDAFLELYPIAEIKEKVMTGTADFWQIIMTQNPEVLSTLTEDKTNSFKNIVVTEGFRTFYLGYCQLVDNLQMNACSLTKVIQAYTNYEQTGAGDLSVLDVAFFQQNGLKC